ncbi:MAG: hypothetical protein WB580_18670, partial [Candidatus Binataceae bacterium]
REQVDHLDAGMEKFAPRTLTGKRRGGAMNRLAQHIIGESTATVDGIADRVDEPAKHFFADWNTNRTARPVHTRAAAESRGALHRDGSHGVYVDMLLDLDQQRPCPIPLHDQGFADRWQEHLGWKFDIDY